MKEAWNKWKKIAKKVGDVQLSILFSLLFFVIFTPLGVATRKNNYLSLNKKPKWRKFGNNISNLSDLQKQ